MHGRRWPRKTVSGDPSEEQEHITQLCLISPPAADSHKPSLQSISRCILIFAASSHHLSITLAC